MPKTPAKKTEWIVGCVDRLAWSARGEDGERHEVLICFVTIEDEATGARWVSRRTFGTLASAGRCVPAVRRRLLSGASPSGSKHWDATWPAYGSPAWQADQVAECAAEREVDEAGSYYDGGVHG